MEQVMQTPTRLTLNDRSRATSSGSVAFVKLGFLPFCITQSNLPVARGLGVTNDQNRQSIRGHD